MPKKPKTKSQAALKREAKIIGELCGEHGYAFLEMPKERDRYLWSFKFSKPAEGATKRILRLAIPMESHLALEMERLTKIKDAKARKKGRK